MPDDRFEEAFDLRRMLLLAIPLVLALVLGGAVFFAYYLPQKQIEWRGGGWRVRADGTPYSLTLPGPAFTDADLAAAVRFGKLERLYLYDASITDAGLEALSKFPHLEELDLSGTAITDAGLALMPRLPQLKYLRLDRCPHITPEGLLALVSERPTLRLSFYGVRIPPDVLQQIWERSQAVIEVDAGAVVPVGPGIDVLWAGTSIPVLPPETHPPTPRVKLLLKRPFPAVALAAIPHPECVVKIGHAHDLVASELPADFCALLTRFEKLEDLFLHSGVDDEGLRHLARLRHLQQLWLSGSGTFTDEGLRALEHHPSLMRLSLRSSHVTGPGLASLATLRNCEWLSLSFDHCDPAACAVLGELSQLKRLSLFRVPLTDADVAFLGRLTRLESVDLYGTRLTDAVLSTLLSLPRLTGFDLGDSPISPAGRELLLRTVTERRAALRESLPPSD